MPEGITQGAGKKSHQQSYPAVKPENYNNDWSGKIWPMNERVARLIEVVSQFLGGFKVHSSGGISSLIVVEYSFIL